MRSSRIFQMLDRVRETHGTRLDRSAYHGQMRVETERVNGTAWKLERSQFFTEAADDPAWQAFKSGDWSKSVDIFEDERESLAAEAAKYARQGSTFCRLRVVEPPVSAYVQWEMRYNANESIAGRSMIPELLYAYGRVGYQLWACRGTVLATSHQLRPPTSASHRLRPFSCPVCPGLGIPK